MNPVAIALKSFTGRWCQHWQEQCGHLPSSAELYGIASPCIVENRVDRVLWQPQPFVPEADLNAVERALEIRIQPSVSAFYTTQFAGEMSASFGQRALVLSQVWSWQDFNATQENLIGHLLMKRCLKQSPTLFIATTNEEAEVISVCNITNEVILEQPGNNKRAILVNSLENFLNQLNPVIN